MLIDSEKECQKKKAQHLFYLKMFLILLCFNIYIWAKRVTQRKSLFLIFPSQHNNKNDYGFHERTLCFNMP